MTALPYRKFISPEPRLLQLLISTTPLAASEMAQVISAVVGSARWWSKLHVATKLSLSNPLLRRLSMTD